MKVNRGWNVYCQRFYDSWKTEIIKWTTRQMILLKNGSIFSLKRRREVILFCGAWTCLNGNKLSHQISTNSHIQGLFDMDLLSCRALETAPQSPKLILIRPQNERWNDNVSGHVSLQLNLAIKRFSSMCYLTSFTECKTNMGWRKGIVIFS